MENRTRDHIQIDLLIEEDGIGWFESSDGEHSIDIPMHFIGTGPDGLPREFRLTESSRAFMIYEPSGGVTVIAEEGDQAIYITTSPTEFGFEVRNVHIFQKHTKH